MDPEVTNGETEMFLQSLPWKDLSGEYVMDVGCGLGNTSTQCILETFPLASRVIAIDSDIECIQLSRSNFKGGLFKKAEFHLVNVAYMRHLRRWRGKISKIVSAHSIPCISKKEPAFRNMFEVLKPGGQAAFIFVARTLCDVVFASVVRNPKWSEYVKEEDRILKPTPEYYEELLKEVGFKIIKCKLQMVEYISSEKEQYKSALKEELSETVCGKSYIETIPNELQDDFMEDAYSTFLTLCPRDQDGLLGYRYYMFEALVEKSADERVK